MVVPTVRHYLLINVNLNQLTDDASLVLRLNEAVGR
jgi:hypothetical protein